MPLIACPDCGREISTAAPSCPQCGRPNSPVVAAPQPASGPALKEETLWFGSPSPLLILGKFLGLAFLAIVLPFALYYIKGLAAENGDAIWRWGLLFIGAILLWRVIVVLIAYARIRSTVYKVTTQRVQIESGLTDKTVEDIDLRYIDDTQFRQRLIERMLGIGNVTLVSSDKTSPTYVLRGIADPRVLRELIRARAYEVSQKQLFTRST